MLKGTTQEGWNMRDKQPYNQRFVSGWVRDEEGVSGTEYAIMLSLIVMGSMAIIGSIGEKFAVLYTIISDSLPEGFI